MEENAVDDMVKMMITTTKIRWERMGKELEDIKYMTNVEDVIEESDARNNDVKLEGESDEK